MKLKILIFAVFSLLLSISSYANYSQDTIKSVKSKSKKFHTILSGTIIDATGSNEFILEDKTGKIKINIALRSEEDQNEFFDKYPYLVGSIVVIEGNINKERLKNPEIDVNRIEVITAPAYDPFIDAISGDSSVIKDIKSAKKLNDSQHLIVSGIVIEMIESDKFLLKDKDENTIIVKIILPTSEKKNEFLNQYQNLVGYSVIVGGFLNKEFLENTSIDANRIHILDIPIEDPFYDAIDKAKAHKELEDAKKLEEESKNKEDEILVIEEEDEDTDD